MSPQTSYCIKCGRVLCADEIAITRKLINRGAVTYYCIPCLAAYFEVDPEAIEERIAYFKEMGCTLFSAEEDAREREKA